MGNANSTTVQAVSSPSNTSTPSRRTSRPDSPSIKSDLKGSTSTRRKKSIELSDVDTSLSPLTSSNNNKGNRRSSINQRRKTTNKPVSNVLEDNSGSGEEDELEPVAGTLRGAMQGRAEHVVYGPRRDDTLTAAGGVGGGGGFTSSDNPSSSAKVNTRRASDGLRIIDPDDTTHPDYKASARLTSAVLLSQDKMPVLVSPKREEFPTGSPFGTTTNLTETRRIIDPTTTSSLAGVSATIAASSSILPPSLLSHSSYDATGGLLPPHTSAPYPPTIPPTNSVLAPFVPTQALPIAVDQIPSGTSVIPTPPYSPALSNTSTSTTSHQHPPSSFPLSSQQPSAQLQAQLLTNPSYLLPPSLFNTHVAAIPIPLLSVPSATIAASLLAAAVDLGAGSEGVPTLIKWKNEDGQVAASERGGRAKGPKEVFVTGTFSNGWKTKIELRKNDAADFSALISLPPGPHRLKFIVDKEWKASKHLPVATDADGNLINYLHVNPGGNNKATAEILDWTNNNNNNSTTGSSNDNNMTTSTSPTNTTTGAGSTSQSTNTSKRQGGVTTPLSKTSAALNTWNILDDNSSFPDDLSETGWEVEDSNWTQEIPKELIEWGEWEAERELIESSLPPNSSPPSFPPPPASSAGVPPPTLPAQLEKGPLNHAAYVTQGSGDDNSILPKPDHSVINHLAASPIKGGFLSVGVTTRYKRKFVTIVYYKALAPRE